jgi:hypothetical protein
MFGGGATAWNLRSQVQDQGETDHPKSDSWRNERHKGSSREHRKDDE